MTGDPERRLTMQIHLPELVVVTGSSSGLGEVIAASLLRSGSEVVGVDVNPHREPLDVSGYTHVLSSVAEESTWEQVLQRCEESQASEVGYVACAAILVLGNAEKVARSEWERILDVNVIGAALGVAALAPRMRAQGGGSIVMVGSVNAQFGEEELLAYNVSKGGMRQLARTAALDYGRDRIRVNMVSPGPMLTDLFFIHMDAAEDPAALRATRENRQPLGEILDPQLVANTVLFMLADEAAGMTGTDVVVDGGLTAGFDYRNVSMPGVDGRTGSGSA